jgi:hypothetical protein
MSGIQLQEIASPNIGLILRAKQSVCCSVPHPGSGSGTGLWVRLWRINELSALHLRLLRRPLRKPTIGLLAHSAKLRATLSEAEEVAISQIPE